MPVPKFEVDELALVNDINSPLYDHLVTVVGGFSSGFYYNYYVIPLEDNCTPYGKYPPYLVGEEFLMKV